jgi:hypothetical protein
VLIAIFRAQIHVFLRLWIMVVSMGELSAQLRFP